MEKDLEDRLDKVKDEQMAYCLDTRELLDLAIMTIEAVKAYKVQSGQYPNLELNCFDRVCGALRESR